MFDFGGSLSTFKIGTQLGGRNLGMQFQIRKSGSYSGNGARCTCKSNDHISHFKYNFINHSSVKWGGGGGKLVQSYQIIRKQRGSNLGEDLSWIPTSFHIQINSV